MATAAQISQFIQTLGRLAVAECNNRIAQGKGFVLPSVCIAQSAIETGWGTAGIMTRANAYFGIKAGGSWTGAVYRADTWEVANGEAYNTTANFRAYPSLAASVTDYYDLIGNNSRYSAALSFGKDRSQWKTAKACITAIWAGGYATDTLYVEKIMSTVNARNLTEYDNMVTGEGTAPIAEGNKQFPPSDWVQGSLLIIDSGRAIENNREDKTAVAVDWAKAPTITANTEYRIKGAFTDFGDYDLYIARLIEDKATITGPHADGATIAVNANEKIGFYLKRKDGAEITDLSFLSDTFGGSVIDMISATLPQGTALYPTIIAHFVKVE